MRLVINGRYLLQHVTGVQRVATEFVKALDTLLAEGAYPGLEVELIAPARGDLVTQPDFSRIKFRRSGHLSGHLWEQLEFPYLAGPDPVLCLGNVAPLLRLLWRRRGIYTMVHDLSYKYFPEAYALSFRLAYSILIPIVLARSTQVITVSESEAAEIAHRYPRLVARDRLAVAQNGGSQDHPIRKVGDGAESLTAGALTVPSRGLRARRCIYVGSLTKRKNAIGLAQAARELASEGIEFVFVGSTHANYRQTGVQSLPDAQNQVRFLGQIDDPLIIESEYRAATVLLFPSFYEASPLPPVEAMGFGTPVVCADIQSLRERCGDAALYCDPTDLTAMVDLVRTLVHDSEAWGQMQEAGLAQAARYSWRGQVRAVLKRIDGVG